MYHQYSAFHSALHSSLPVAFSNIQASLQHNCASLKCLMCTVFATFHVVQSPDTLLPAEFSFFSHERNCYLSSRATFFVILEWNHFALISLKLEKDIYYRLAKASPVPYNVPQANPLHCALYFLASLSIGIKVGEQMIKIASIVPSMFFVLSKSELMCVNSP